MKSFYENKVVIITGSSKGIGFALAKILGAYGARLVINGRDALQLERSAKELSALNFTVFSVKGDITLENDRHELIERTREKFGRIDILVNNAGRSMRGKLEELSPLVISSIFEINTIAPIQLTQLALPHIKQSEGSVIFVSSLAGLKGLPLISIYGSAKMALTGITEALRAEHARENIHFGIYYVGYTAIEKGKVTYGPAGETLLLDERKGPLVMSIEQVARSISELIWKRKKKSVIGLTGKFFHLLIRVSPRFMELLIIKSYSRMKNAYK